MAQLKAGSTVGGKEIALKEEVTSHSANLASHLSEFATHEEAFTTHQTNEELHGIYTDKELISTKYKLVVINGEPFLEVIEV